MRRKRLGIEALEDRRLLTAAPSAVDLSALALDASEHRATSLLVQFKQGASSAGSLAAHLATSGLGAEWNLTPGLRRVELDAGTDWAAALAAYKNDPNVEYAQPDHRVSLNVTPDDPELDKLYGLDNSGQTNGTADADIDAPEAWDVTTGSQSTIVAVIDTGVDYRHPDLAANIWTNTKEIAGNNRDDDGNGYVDDIHGYDFANRDGDPMDDHFHGTHVAGTIGAVGDNGIGVVGVNWHVQIMALKFLDASGGGYESDAIAALNYAVANGAVVSNNSWGGGAYSAAFESAMRNAASKGHIFVAAAGNDGWNNDLDAFYPAGYNVDNVISVAATDHNDQLAWFSNYGKKSVDLAAPGVNIYSTFPTQTTPAMRDGGFGPNYASISGTSMATPHVTGVVALVHSLHPDWSYDRIIQQIYDTVDVVDGAAQTVTGGRLNAAAAVGNAPPDTNGPRVVGSEPTDGVVGAVDHVRLRFSESLDVTTIGLEDVVSLTGPEGAIAVTSVVPVAGNNRQVDVKFAAQSTLGNYSLVFGANISDLAGNLADQDRDGIGGEEIEDSYTATFQISDIIGFNSFDVPKEIDNLGSLFGQYTESILSINQDISVADVNVQLDIWFPYDGDLTIVLQSPRGTKVTLSANNGGEGADFYNTIFDDEASTSISSGFAPFAGTYRPNQLLSRFDGENARGDWTLRVIADFNIDHFLDGVGGLDAWSLQLAGGGGAPPPPPPPPPPGNRAPVATDDSLQGEVNTRLAVPAAQLLANDTDPDGDPLSITFVGTPVGGSVSLGANQLVIFEPAADFTGAASFQYIVSDGFNIDIGNVSVNVQPQFQFNNARLPQDVDGNGVVTAGDALTIINILNSIGSTPLVSLLSDGLAPDEYLDVKADNWVAASDALEVINYINANPRQAEPLAAAEGESTAASSANDAALMSLLAADAAACDLTAAAKSRTRGAAAGK